MIAIRREGWIKAEDVPVGGGFDYEGKTYVKLPDGKFLFVPTYTNGTKVEITGIHGTANGIELDVEVHFWRKKSEMEKRSKKDDVA